MLIQTYEHGYKVISHILTNGLADIYICRDIVTDLEYTILRIKEKVIIPGLMVCLDMNIQKDTFADYIEHFIFEDDLCLVFKYYRGISLLEKLNSERCSLSERMKIGKKILDRIVFLEMPLYFLNNCLTGERIIVKQNLEAFFNYVPEDIHEFAAVDDQAVLKTYTDIFSLLFADELSKQTAPPINEFYSALHKEQYFDSIALYKQYAEMCQKVLLIPQEELNKPKSKWFLLWERTKKQLKALKKVLAVALITLAVVYLAFTIKEFISPTITRVNHFKFIGTLEIDQVQPTGGNE